VSVGGFDAAQDAGQHRDEVGVGGHDPFSIGLGRADLQQRHHLAGGRLILAQAQVGEFEEFLDPDAGAPQDLDHRGAPEGVVLLAFGVETRSRIAIVADGGDEHCGGPPVAVASTGASIPGLLHAELLACRGVSGGVQDE
jgi:hypothetical protein